MGTHGKPYPPFHDVQCMVEGQAAAAELKTASCNGVDEVARLFQSSINAASRFIYIENQFTSAAEVAQTLAQRMVDVPSLHVLIVTPKARSLHRRHSKYLLCRLCGDFFTARLLELSPRCVCWD